MHGGACPRHSSFPPCWITLYEMHKRSGAWLPQGRLRVLSLRRSPLPSILATRQVCKLQSRVYFTLARVRWISFSPSIALSHFFFLFLRERKKFDKKGCIEALNEANSPLTFVSVLRLFRAVESAVRGRHDRYYSSSCLDRSCILNFLHFSFNEEIGFIFGRYFIISNISNICLEVTIVCLWRGI